MISQEEFERLLACYYSARITREELDALDLSDHEIVVTEYETYCLVQVKNIG